MGSACVNNSWEESYKREQRNGAVSKRICGVNGRFGVLLFMGFMMGDTGACLFAEGNEPVQKKERD